MSSAELGVLTDGSHLSGTSRCCLFAGRSARPPSSGTRHFRTSSDDGTLRIKPPPEPLHKPKYPVVCSREVRPSGRCQRRRITVCDSRQTESTGRSQPIGIHGDGETNGPRAMVKPAVCCQTPGSGWFRGAKLIPGRQFLDGWFTLQGQFWAHRLPQS